MGTCLLRLRVVAKIEPRALSTACSAGMARMRSARHAKSPGAAPLLSLTRALDDFAMAPDGAATVRGRQNQGRRSGSTSSLTRGGWPFDVTAFYFWLACRRILQHRQRFEGRSCGTGSAL